MIWAILGFVVGAVCSYLARKYWEFSKNQLVKDTDDSGEIVWHFPVTGTCTGKSLEAKEKCASYVPDPLIENECVYCDLYGLCHSKQIKKE